MCDQGLKVNFTKLECLVPNKDNEVIMTGTKSNNSCYLWGPQETECFSMCMMSNKDESRLWNQNLCHIHLKGMMKVLSSEAVRDIPKLKIDEDKIYG